MIPAVESLPMPRIGPAVRGRQGMSFAETISPFFGRCAFVWFYLTSAIDIVNNWHAIAADLTTKHVPLPPLVLLVVLLLIAMGQ